MLFEAETGGGVRVEMPTNRWAKPPSSSERSSVSGDAYDGVLGFEDHRLEDLPIVALQLGQLPAAGDRRVGGRRPPCAGAAPRGSG
jgi:hypothetical protein